MVWGLIFYFLTVQVADHFARVGKDDDEYFFEDACFSALWPLTFVWDGLKALKELNNMEETE